LVATDLTKATDKVNKLQDVKILILLKLLRMTCPRLATISPKIRSAVQRLKAGAINVGGENYLVQLLQGGQVVPR
jgi:hypothetical protein